MLCFYIINNIKTQHYSFVNKKLKGKICFSAFIYCQKLIILKDIF